MWVRDCRCAQARSSKHGTIPEGQARSRYRTIRLPPKLHVERDRLQDSGPRGFCLVWFAGAKQNDCLKMTVSSKANASLVRETNTSKWHARVCPVLGSLVLLPCIFVSFVSYVIVCAVELLLYVVFLFVARVESNEKQCSTACRRFQHILNRQV